MDDLDAFDMAELVVETRKRLLRQRRIMSLTRKRMHQDIRLAHKHGASVTRLAKIAGVTPGRIYQILKED